MRDFLPELIALPLLPLLYVQGRRTRRLTPRLPVAAGPTTGIVGEGRGRPPLRLLSLGESPVAGVGVALHDEAITGCLAASLSARLRTPVAWQACGQNGATVRDALAMLPTISAGPIDLALVAFGVNDTTAFQPARRWRHDLVQLLDALRERCHPRLIVLSGVPPVGHFPALPQPLRAVLGLKAQVLDRGLQAVARSRSDTVFVPLHLNTRDPALMAHDGYHPSAAGCRAWANMLADACVGRIAAGE